MSSEKMEKILSTYPPVKEKPGYVWVNRNSIVQVEILREAYEKYFSENAYEGTKDGKKDDE